METITKHTPGDWKVRETVNAVNIGGALHVVIPVASDFEEGEKWAGTGVAICILPHGEHTPEDRAMAEANAKLIASSPDMLKIIQEADAWLSFNGHPSREEIQNFRKSLQQAIKKATE